MLGQSTILYWHKETDDIILSLLISIVTVLLIVKVNQELCKLREGAPTSIWLW